MVGPFLSRNWLLMAESQGDPGRQIWSTNLQNGYNFNLASSLAVILNHYIECNFNTEPLFSYFFFHTSYSILTIRKVPFRKLLRSLTLVFFNTEVKWKTSFFLNRYRSQLTVDLISKGFWKWSKKKLPIDCLKKNLEHVSQRSTKTFKIYWISQNIKKI